MKRMLMAVGVLALAAGMAAAEAGKQDAKPVAYPAGYRDWTHVRSMLIHSDKHPLFGAFGGIHHVYANDKALTALQKQQAFPDGASFAFDLLESPESGGAYTEGNRKILATMVKDAKKYPDTGGWGFQAWAGGDQAKPALKLATEQVGCFQCHTQVAAKGHVFTTWRP